MASLLSQASSYEENDSTIFNENRQNRKNINKTIKKRPTQACGVEPGKKKCIETLMQLTDSFDDDDDETGLVDFQPPSKPELTRVPNNSHGQNQTRGQNKGPTTPNLSEINTNLIQKFPLGNNTNSNNSQQNSSQPSLYSNAYSVPKNLEENFNNAISNGGNGNNYDSTNTSRPFNSGNGNIHEQLNYIIHLLEEQQNVKTSTTTEELILYTFLGVFTIYIVDSFTKVSKTYTR